MSNELFKIPQKPENKKRHYIFIPCKTDDLGMKLEWENESDVPTDGDWNWWMDKDGNVEFARMKEDAYDHFYPPTKHLNLRGTDWEPQSLSGYFKDATLKDITYYANEEEVDPITGEPIDTISTVLSDGSLNPFGEYGRMR